MNLFFRVTFRNKLFLQWGVVSPSPNFPSWRATPCRLPATAYSVHSPFSKRSEDQFSKRTILLCQQRVSTAVSFCCWQVSYPVLCADTKGNRFVAMHFAERSFISTGWWVGEWMKFLRPNSAVKVRIDVDSEQVKRGR